MPKKKAEIRCLKITTDKEKYDFIKATMEMSKRISYAEHGQTINDATALYDICIQYQLDPNNTHYLLPIIEE